MKIYFYITLIVTIIAGCGKTAEETANERTISVFKKGLSTTNDSIKEKSHIDSEEFSDSVMNILNEAIKLESK